MARRHRADKRELTPDPRYNNELVAYMINCVMQRGKKSVAAKIVYGALEDIQKQVKDEDPVEVFTTAIENVSPRLEVKSRRVGGATYQVPLEVKPARQIALATRWLIRITSYNVCYTKLLRTSTASAMPMGAACWPTPPRPRESWRSRRRWGIHARRSPRSHPASIRFPKWPESA